MEHFPTSHVLVRGYSPAATNNTFVLISISLDRFQEYSLWMLRALSNKEIREWLKEVKATTPDFLFYELLTLAQKELPASRWSDIKINIANGAVAV